MNADIYLVLRDVTCPSCGSEIVLMEDRKFVWLGCERCRIFVRVTKSSISKKVRGCMFPWRDIIKELISTLYQVCQQ
ncbi:MAG: hypothetical protein GXO23_01665 [Crenarchaeota archaeon]|nr:hypothetical protein [Thermoproteota archaeon]